MYHTFSSPQIRRRIESSSGDSIWRQSMACLLRLHWVQLKEGMIRYNIYPFLNHFFFFFGQGDELIDNATNLSSKLKITLKVTVIIEKIKNN